MKKALLSFLLLISFLLPIKASDGFADIATRVSKSVVYIEAGGEFCTGFVIDANRKYVLTAAHCDLRDTGTMQIDHVAPTLVSKDAQKDLAVFSVKDLDPSRPALELSNKPVEIGDELMSVGYGMALDHPIFRKHMVSHISLASLEDSVIGPFVLLDNPLIAGQSGGPVVDHAGNVVMIAQRTSEREGMGVGVETIKERMGRFFGSK